jgi:hypothetical protein
LKLQTFPKVQNSHFRVARSPKIKKDKFSKKFVNRFGISNAFFYLANVGLQDQKRPIRSQMGKSFYF